MTEEQMIVGKIFTGNTEKPWAEAMAIRDGKIIAAGNAEKVKQAVAPDVEIKKVDSGIVMPGMTDAHSHFSYCGPLRQKSIDLFEYVTKEDTLKAIKEFVDQNPEDEYYIGNGWSTSAFENGPNRQMLDQICSDKPMVLMSEDGHGRWGNTKALELAGITADTESELQGEIVLDENGEPTGYFREWIGFLLDNAVSAYSVEGFKNGILEEQEVFLSNGITALFEPVMERPEKVRKAYEELDAEGRLKLRVQTGFFCNQRKSYRKQLDTFYKESLAYQGTKYRNDFIKIMVDGVVEGQTAFLFEEYSNQPGYHGMPNWSQEEMNDLCCYAKALGFQIHIHAIGDAALDMALTALETAEKIQPKNGWLGDFTEFRPAITHLQIVRPEDIRRMKKLGVVAVSNPYWFFKEEGYFEEVEKPVLGDRAEKEYPLKSFLNEDVLLTAASDYPVTSPVEPFGGMEVAVNRYYPHNHPETLLNPDECVDLDTMMYAYTWNGAYQLGTEQNYGSLEEGKEADFVITDQNPWELDDKEYGKVKVLETWLHGKCVYKREE